MHQRCEERSQVPDPYVDFPLSHRTSLTVCGAGDRGYKDEDIVLLSDDSRDPRLVPTKQNIMNAMHWLVYNADPHDALFFHCKSPLS